jgi:DHA1 family tetracycline resistance protein-like MFS transporter
VGAAIVQGGLVHRAVSAFGERRALLVGLAFGVMGFVVYGAAPSGIVFLVGVPLFSILGVSYPSALALMTRRVGPSQQGQLQGALASLAAVAGIAAPPVFTRAFAWAIDPSRTYTVPGLPFYLSAVLLALSMAIAVGKGE